MQGCTNASGEFAPVGRRKNTTSASCKTQDQHQGKLKWDTTMHETTTTTTTDQDLVCACIITFHMNERQGSELHTVKKEEGKEKQQLTGPEPMTSRSIAKPLAVEPWSLPGTINLFLYHV